MALVWFLIAAIPISHAGPDEADAAVRRGDFSTAFRELKPLADAGDARALAGLGRLYSNGWGVPADIPKARRLLQEARDKGNLDALYQMGFLPPEEDDERSGPVRAAAYWKEAAERGHARSQEALAQAYLLGRGIEKDLKKSAHWYLQAANKGIVTAQLSFGAACASGRGVPKDLTRAYMWLTIAMARQGPLSRYETAKTRKSFGSGLSTVDIARAEEMARAWLGDYKAGNRAELEEPVPKLTFSAGKISLAQWTEFLGEAESLKNHSKLFFSSNQFAIEFHHHDIVYFFTTPRHWAYPALMEWRVLGTDRNADVQLTGYYGGNWFFYLFWRWQHVNWVEEFKERLSDLG